MSGEFRTTWKRKKSTNVSIFMVTSRTLRMRFSSISLMSLVYFWLVRACSLRGQQILWQFFRQLFFFWFSLLEACRVAINGAYFVCIYLLLICANINLYFVCLIFVLRSSSLFAFKRFVPTQVPTKCLSDASNDSLSFDFIKTKNVYRFWLC